MRKLKIVAAAVGIAGAVALSAMPAFAADCINKAGEGTDTTEAGAKFQSFEIILQTTSIPTWMQWMASNPTVGVVPGYKVSNLKSKCSKDQGLGYKCVTQATLCKI